MGCVFDEFGTTDGVAISCIIDVRVIDGNIKLQDILDILWVECMQLNSLRVVTISSIPSL